MDSGTGLQLTLYANRNINQLEVFMRFAAYLFVFLASVFLMSQQANAQTQSYQSFVVVPDVESKYIDGEFRFCPRKNLRGLICGEFVDVFGRQKFMVRDWWSPTTYAQAYTRSWDVEVTAIGPTPDGRGVVIYFR